MKLPTRYWSLGLLVALSLIAQLAHPVLGQAHDNMPDEQKPSSSLSTLLSQLDRGEVLKVASNGEGTQHGKYALLDEQSLLLSRRSSAVTILLDNVEMVWVQDGDLQNRGFFIGTAAGALVGVYYFLALDGAHDSDVNLSRSIPVGLFAGALVGGAVGAIVGTYLPHWVQLYPLPQR